MCCLLAAGTPMVKAQHLFVIDGQLAKDKEGVIVLEYTSRGVYIIDSAIVKNGHFTFKGTLGDPVYATLNLNPYRGDLTEEKAKQIDVVKFFIEGNTAVKSNAGIKEAMITGGKAQADYLVRDALYAPLNAQLKPLNEQIKAFYKEKNMAAMKPLQAQIAALAQQGQQLDSAFIRQHPDSYVAFDIWKSRHKGYGRPEWRTDFERFSKRIRKTEEGKVIAGKIAKADLLSTGKPAPDFTLTDIAGSAFSLSGLQGKNVVLVFWYRSFTSFETFSLYLRRAEKRLKDKNTVLVGVSYDEEDTWKAAVTESFPDWIHVNALNQVTSGNSLGAIALDYAVYSKGDLPAGYIIGPDGKFLSGRLMLNDNELGLKLEKLVSKK